MSKSMRIMIFGPPGAGKSTFAVNLSQSTKLPLYHLDKYFYVRNWIERDYQEFLSIQHRLVNQDSWIIDGNNTKSLEIRYARAQIVLYFNFPKRICLWRIIKRRFNKDLSIDDRAESCPEVLRWSLVKYLWTFNNRIKENLKKLREIYPEVNFFIIKNAVDLKKVEQVIKSYF